MGSIAGMLIGLAEGIIFIPKFDIQKRIFGNMIEPLFWGTVTYALIVGLSFGLISMLVMGFIAGFADGETGMSELRYEWLSVVIFIWQGLLLAIYSGFTIGLPLGFIYTSRVTTRHFDEYVRPVESIQWSWKSAHQNAGKGLIYGLSYGIIYALFIERRDPLIIYGPISGLTIGAVGSLIGGLVGGFQAGKPSWKTYPNQGIWLTVQLACKIGLPTGIILGITRIFFTNSIMSGLAYGLSAFFVIALWCGGLDVIEHFIIRLILSIWGYAPLNYARFLSYAAEELHFLQRVGGGYVFIHRYLLEHFAEIAVERGYVDVNARRHPESY